MEDKSPGVLLQAIPYLGRQKILKVFTPEEGLVSLIAKSANPSWTAFTSPFCIAEWVYKKGQREIYPLKDGSVLESLLELRQTYDSLNAAGSIAQDVLKTQLPGKRAPALYELLCVYLKKLGSFPNPASLAASFRLKLLLHEGLLSLEDKCSLCAASALHLHEGQSYCLSHAPFPGISFSPEEWESISLLAYGRKFSFFEQISSAPIGKIGQLFEERIKN
jgi:DNA repair protein RecO